MTELARNIRTINDYISLKPVNEQYNKAKDKDKFFREHESDLMIFGSAKKAVEALLQDNGKLPNVQTLQKRYDELNDKKAALMKQYGEIKTEITELERLKDNVEKMERSERTKTRNDDIT